MLIGILGHYTETKSYGNNAAYVEYFREKGDVILLDAQNESTLPLDLLVLPGGKDVNPLNYRQKPHRYTQSPDLEYEWFYSRLFKKYLQKAVSGETAIYGICAGFQHLNVQFGGTLAQHISQAYSDSNNRGQLVDHLNLVEGNQGWLENYSFLENFVWFKNQKTKVYKNKLKTNSIHHQGIFENNLAENLLPLATNSLYGNIEIFMHKELPIAAEQAHPEERDSTPYTDALLIEIVSRLNKYKK